MSEFDKFKEQLLKKYIKEGRTTQGWAKAQETLTITEADNLTPAELAQAEALQKQWTALSERGQKEGWLQWSGGYHEGEWEVTPKLQLKHPTRTVSRQEFAGERQSRLDQLDYRIKKEARERLDREMRKEKSRW